MIIFFHIRKEYVINQIKRIHRLQQFKFLVLVYLTHIRLRCIEKHTVHKCGRPYHLHLHNEYPSSFVSATHINYAVLLQRSIGHKLDGKIFYTLYLLILCFKRQESVQKANHKSRMFSKHFLECQICFRVKISHTTIFFSFSANISRNNIIYKKSPCTITCTEGQDLSDKKVVFTCCV